MYDNFLKRLENAILGGSQVYSKRKDKVPNNFLVILKKAFGAYFFDNNNKFLRWEIINPVRRFNWKKM